MTRPPDDLKSWPKNGLVREVRRLRAILYEHSQHIGDKPQGEVAEMADVHGDPFAHGGVILDARRAVLMDSMDVAIMDPFTEGKPTRDLDKLAVALMLAGRINHSDERSRQVFLFPGDGIAALVTELLAVAERGGPDFAAYVARCIDERTEALPKRPTDNDPEGGDSAMDQQEEQTTQDAGEPTGAPEEAAQGAADAAQGTADAADAATGDGQEPQGEDAAAKSDDEPEPEDAAA